LNTIDDEEASKTVSGSQGADKTVAANAAGATGVAGSTRELAPSVREFSNGYRYYVLGLLLAIYTANYMDRMILGILLQPIKTDLGASDTMMGLLTGLLFAIFYATLGMPIAWWADRGSRKTIITLALTIWSGMTMACGLAANFWQLAVARMFVGVGEAGGSPPSHSIIADLFESNKRSTALAIFALGVPLGLLFGFPLAGRIYEAWGWRVAFMSLGAPGLFLAALAFFTLREPPRGLSEETDHDSDAEAPKFLEVWAFMWSQKSLRHLIAGTTLAALVGYAGVNWLPSFLALTHEMTTLQIVDSLALLIGIGGLIGTFGGGFFADYLGKKDVAWKAKIVGATILGIFPIGVLVYMTNSTAVALGGILFTSIAGTVYLGPTFALTQTLVTVRMRALGAAILLFILNLFGMSLGPTMTGVLSDLYRPMYGDDSVRWALFTVGMFGLWAAFHFFCAAKHLKGDLARVEDLNAAG
jgi:predicted MFS family arabinose efflux permease